jgi:hypothetical protein
LRARATRVARTATRTAGAAFEKLKDVAGSAVEGVKDTVEGLTNRS